MATVFISYSSKDKQIATNVAQDIEHLGHKVWLDEWFVRIGDCIPTKIEEGIESADFILLLLSCNAVESKWVEREWKIAYWEEVNKNRIMILPVCIEQCTVPKLLQTKKYAKLYASYKQGIDDIQKAINDFSIQRARDNFYHAVEMVKNDFNNSSPNEALLRYAHWNRFDNKVKSLNKSVSIEVQRLNSLYYLKEYGLSVKQLKEQLTILDVYHGVLNDSFTAEVADSIINFQRYHYLRHIDGVFGPLTYIAMYDATMNLRNNKK